MWAGGAGVPRVHVAEVHAAKVHAAKVHAVKVHAAEVHAAEVHAAEMHDVALLELAQNQVRTAGTDSQTFCPPMRAELDRCCQRSTPCSWQPYGG